jgi:hypothetical protein
MKQPHALSHLHRSDLGPGFLSRPSGSFFGRFAVLGDFRP